MRKHLAFGFFLASAQVAAHAQQLHYSVSEAYAIHDSINKSRWDVGGRVSHYSFRYMSEFFPTAISQKSDTPFQFIERPLKAVSNLTVKDGDETIGLRDYLKRRHINSIIVVHKGAIVFEEYNQMQPADQHSLQSVTKVITSTLIARLINEKKLDPNLPVEHYLPLFKNTEWEGTSVRSILNMRSGMKGSELSEGMGGFTNPQHPYYSFEEALGVLPKVDSIVPSVLGYIATMKRNRAAGKEAEYNSMNTFILGCIAERLTGKKYADLVSEMIWKPIGASSNAYVCASEGGVAWMHGGISATLRDLARFGMLYTYSDIKRRKEGIVSFLQLKEIFSASSTDLGFEKFKWGYQWDVARDGMLMKTGFGGQALVIHPEKEMVIAYFNFIDNDWSKNNLLTWDVINAVVRAVEGRK